MGQIDKEEKVYEKFFESIKLIEDDPHYQNLVYGRSNPCRQ